MGATPMHPAHPSTSATPVMGPGSWHPVGAGRFTHKIPNTPRPLHKEMNGAELPTAAFVCPGVTTVASRWVIYLKSASSALALLLILVDVTGPTVSRPGVVASYVSAWSFKIVWTTVPGCSGTRSGVVAPLTGPVAGLGRPPTSIDSPRTDGIGGVKWNTREPPK